MKSLINKHHQAGLSLIELMVALVLSMLLMLGVTQIFLSSKATYSTNQELSEIQESGRFALDILVRDIADAGYQGQCYRNKDCKDSPDSPCLPRNHLKDGVNGEIWSQIQGPFLGWAINEAPSFTKAPADSEGLFIQFASGGKEYLLQSGTTPRKSDDKILLNRVFQGDIALVSNGHGCDLFENITDSSLSDKFYINKESDYEWSDDYGTEYSGDKSFEVLEFKSIAYYIDKDDGNDVLSLYREVFDYYGKPIGDPELLVPGVERMQLKYGIKNNGNSIDDYVYASEIDNSSWGKVAAVKVTLTIKAESGFKKDFSSVVVLRNRL